MFVELEPCGRSYNELVLECGRDVEEVQKISDSLCFEHTLRAAGLRACVGHAIVLSVKADDEHWPAMHIAARLIRGQIRCIGAPGRDIADSLAEATPAKLVSTAEEVDGIVGTVRSDAGFHGSKMFVTEGEDVRPHDSGEFSIRGPAGKSEYRVSRIPPGEPRLSFADNPMLGGAHPILRHDQKTKIR